MSKTTIVILHGWGLQKKKYEKLTLLLQQKGYKVFALDLPGFGAEPLQNANMTLDDYVLFVRNFLKKHAIQKPIFIGHSFGGRIAVKYAFVYPKDLSKLILTGVPIIRHMSFIKKIFFVFAIVGGKVFSVFPKETKNIIRKMFYFLIGEWDYYKAGNLQQVFKNIISESLIDYVKEIRVPTLLVWGVDDKLVPYEDVVVIKKLMPQAESVIVQHAGHKLPYENPDEFYLAIKNFL